MSGPGEDGPRASPLPWGIASVLSLKVWSAGNGSRRGTGFFLAPYGSVSLGCMSCCLLAPAGSAGLPLKEERASLCCCCLRLLMRQLASESC